MQCLFLSMPASIPTPAELDALLTQHFGFPAFHSGQREPIETVLGGGDAVVVMPTGSGKSVCYQLPALVLDGITLVVSPLISLMKDQVDGLVARGLPATSLNSSLSAEEAASRIAALRQGQTRLVYVAPERFRNTRFRELLESLHIALVAIDEAHCISQWGHDFRPDYLRLGEMVSALPNARIMALTATATPEVRDDIIKQLGLGTQGRPAPQTFVRGFRRDNLRLTVSRPSTHDEKLRRIESVVSEFPTGIVYCSTRKQVERVGAMLAQLKLKYIVYHAGLPDDQRSRAQERFMNGEVPVVVATNAFGMGVDRSDLRFVLHWDVPGSIEAYYQEVGRAGRDGELSHCELLYNYADVRTQEFFIDGSNPDPGTILAVWDEVRALLAREPQTCSLDEWSEQIHASDNKIAVHTCMGLYERCGLIAREIKSGTRCYTTSLVKGGDVGRLRAMLPGLDEKRLRDLRKLDQMLRYAGARRCRHRFILDYFGERQSSNAPCGHCDFCGFQAVVPARPPTESEWLLLQKLLSAVGRLAGKADRATVIATLTGVRTAAVTDVGAHELPTHGALADEPADYLGSVFNELVRVGAITLGAAPLCPASLTKLGRDLAWRRATTSLHWPKRHAAAPDAPAVRMPRVQPWEKPSSKRRGPDEVNLDRVLSAKEDAIYENLREWRQQEAASQGLPAFTVCSNKTLKAIAILQPDTLAKLGAVKGIGPAKLDAYGADILRILHG